MKKLQKKKRLVKWKKKGKIKSHSRNCVPDPLNWVQKYLQKVLLIILKVLGNPTFEFKVCSRKQTSTKFFHKISLRMSKFVVFGTLIHDSSFPFQPQILFISYFAVICSGLYLFRGTSTSTTIRYHNGIPMF